MPHTEKIKNLLSEISVRSIDAGQGDEIEMELRNMVKAVTQPKGVSGNIGSWYAENGNQPKQLWQVKNGDIKSVSPYDAVEKLKAGEVIMYESTAGPVYMSAKEYDGMMYLQCMTANYAAQAQNNDSYRDVASLNLPEPSLLDRIINAICEFFNAGKREVCEEWDMAHTLENIKDADNQLGDVKEKVQAEERKEENKRLQEEAKVEKKNNERIKLENEEMRAHAEMIENNLKEMPEYAKANGLGEKINNLENNFNKKYSMGDNAHEMTIFDKGGFSYNAADKPGFMGQRYEAEVSKYDLGVIAACSANGVTDIGAAMNGKGVGSVRVNAMVRSIDNGTFNIKDYQRGINNAEKYLGNLDPSSPEAFRIGEVYGKFTESGTSMYSWMYHASSEADRKGLSEIDEYVKPKHIENILDFQARVRDGLKALNNLADDNYYKNHPGEIKSSLQTAAKGMMAYEMLKTLGKMAPEARAEFLNQPKNMEAYKIIEKDLSDYIDGLENLADKKNVMSAMKNGSVLTEFKRAQTLIERKVDSNSPEKYNDMQTPGNEKQPEPMVPGVK